MMWIVDKQGNLFGSESFDEIVIANDDWQNNEQLNEPPQEKKVWFVVGVRLDPYKRVDFTDKNLTHSEAAACLKRIRECLACEKPLCDPSNDSMEKAFEGFFDKSNSGELSMKKPVCPGVQLWRDGLGQDEGQDVVSWVNDLNLMLSNLAENCREFRHDDKANAELYQDLRNAAGKANEALIELQDVARKFDR